MFKSLILKTEKDRVASEIGKRCGLMQDYALECGDTDMFFKYHAMALRLIQYRVNLRNR
jgi:hypothetical protein